MIKNKLILLLALVSSVPLYARDIVDMAGRTVSIPSEINRVLPYDVKTSLLIYPVAKTNMIARAKMQGRSQFKYINDHYNTLAEYDIRNIEVVLTYKPDLIITATAIGRSNTEKYLRLGKRINIPVVLIDLSIEHLAESYRFLGQLFNDSSLAYPCANYLDSTLNALSQWATEHQQEHGAYFTLGSKGLLSDAKGSVHTEVLDYLNIPNVVDLPIETGGHAKVNLEQIINWNPSYIFVADFRGKNDGYQHITSNHLWQNIQAVKQQQVYKVPYYPVGWFDHPPSINRVLGLIWLSHIYHHLPSDRTEDYIRDFFTLFFNYPLNKTDYEIIIHP